MMERLEAERIETLRKMAGSKLAEYRRQCWRLAGLVRQGIVAASDAADVLQEVAELHSLINAHGQDRIQAMIAEAFAGANFNPLCAEVA